MGDTVSAHLDTDQIESLKTMIAEGDADNKSEALRTAVGHGLKELGYTNGATNMTSLRSWTQQFRDAFLLLGTVMLAALYFFPVEVRVLAVAPLFSAFACHVIDRGLARFEPRVSDWLRGAVGSDPT